MKALLLILCLIAALPQARLRAETVKDREGAVRQDRSRMEKDARWIYNDWKLGFERAKATGKPLMVVLRCVPCLACAGIDATVLNDSSLDPLLDQFVCVRVMNANALDLSLFQFDYDLSFSTMFFNGDGTIYGRYGSWTHQKDPYNKTISGFTAALRAALAIHQAYPANKDSLQGKQGKPMPVNDPLQLPQLTGKYRRELDWEGKVVQSCVHCHQVSDAIRSSYRKESKEIPQQWVFPMPNPETIGLKLAPEHAARVESVTAGSIAAESGFQPGDELLVMNGQPLISGADVAWILHHAPDSGSLSARVKRGADGRSLNIDLPEGWRTRSDISRRVGTWAMRAMALGGLLLEELTPDQRDENGLGAETMALLVKHVGQYGEHAAAKKAGFQKGDILLEVDGISRRLTESELIGHLLSKHFPGAAVPVRILRARERLTLALPIQ